MTAVTLTPADAAAACSPVTVNRPATQEEVAREMARIMLHKPEHGPGIDAPPEVAEGRLPDGRRWTWRVEWSPHHAVIRAELTLWDDRLRGVGPSPIVLSLGASDLDGARRAAAALGIAVPGAAKAPGLYPDGWPTCPGCGAPALDGHITCGDVRCGEAERR